MRTYQELTFEEITEEDIAVLTPMMRRAFDEDTRIHLGEESGGPPGYDNGDLLRKYGLSQDITSYKISMHGNVIGAIILWINPTTHQNYLGNIFIDTEVESQGIGKKVWEFVESEFPSTEIWQAETPIYSRRNHHFYVNKCGFHVVEIKNPKSLEDGSYILEKRMK